MTLASKPQPTSIWIWHKQTDWRTATNKAPAESLSAAIVPFLIPPRVHKGWAFGALKADLSAKMAVNLTLTLVGDWRLDSGVVKEPHGGALQARLHVCSKLLFSTVQALANRPGGPSIGPWRLTCASASSVHA